MTRSRVCVCGLADDSTALNAFVQAIRGAGSWEVVPIRWPLDQAMLQSVEGMLGLVLVGGGGSEAGLALQSTLALREEDVPLIVLGEDPCVAARPTCWFRDGKQPAMIATILGQALRNSRSSRPPPSLSWRRKTDMIIGNSPVIQQLLQTLDRVASSSASVLISGESGTGKELVARALHYCGPRAREPFIAINCAAIPEALFEAELFGYLRGAFTGASTSRAGAFEAANKGTLFLDEIGELPLALQPKLLRVLETGQIVRLGSNEPRSVAVRVVSATNRDLEQEVVQGRFREDLFYRLRVFPVRVPPLRSRPEDIAPIIHHHLAIIAARENRPVPRLTPAALEKLITHHWKGNVRELVNALERAFVLGSPIDAEHLDLTSTPPPSAGISARVSNGPLTTYRAAKQLFEEDYFDQLMRVSGGNVSFAAKLSKKTRKEIYDALKRVGLDATRYRTSDTPPESSEDIS